MGKWAHAYGQALMEESPAGHAVTVRGLVLSLRWKFMESVTAHLRHISSIFLDSGEWSMGTPISGLAQPQDQSSLEVASAIFLYDDGFANH
jgi:hypothetical protein